MEKFRSVSSKVIPLPMKDVDTDMIIPAQFLTSISREGYGANLFRRWRDSDTNFPLNLEKYKGAQVLVADANFGCGSSREHAVWALADAGIKVVICKSFADIFYNNSAKNGLLLVTLEQTAVDEMLKRAKEEVYSVTVELETQTVITPWGAKYTFPYDPFRRHCLLNGLDDIDYIKSFQSDIESFRTEQKKHQSFSLVGGLEVK
jgi:3-isopropylmalate/(R)-2-methylmalate dehydratase small subunit